MPAPAGRTAARLLLLATDLAVLAAVFAVAILVRRHFDPTLDLAPYLRALPALLVFPGLYAMARLYADLPPGPSDELKRLVQATTLGFVALAAVTFLAKGGELFSRLAFLGAWVAALAAVPTARAMLRSVFARRSWWSSPVLILGGGATAQIVIRNLQANPALALRPVAVLDDDEALHGRQVEGVPVVGRCDLAASTARELGCAHCIVAMPGAPPERLRALWRDLGPEFPHLIVVPGLYGFASLWVEAKDMGGILGLEARQALLMPGPRAAKRLCDVVATTLGCLAISPVLLALTVLVATTSRGPVFYGQERIGRGGRRFKAWKFRSMRADADAVLKDYLAAHPELRAEWERDHKLKDDPRVTWIGRFLRKTSLDELPQLWNVLRGQMSLVGPRPIVEKEVAKYGDHLALYHRVRPGITGLWQVSGRNNTTYEQRVWLDAYYVRNWSVWLDIFILAKTVRVVVRGEGAY